MLEDHSFDKLIGTHFAGRGRAWSLKSACWGFNLYSTVRPVNDKTSPTFRSPFLKIEVVYLPHKALVRIFLKKSV